MRKTAEIRDIIDTDNSVTSKIVVMDADFAFGGQRLTHLEAGTQDEVSDIIMKYPSKSCDVDP